MLSAFIVVFRESLEAALIVTIVLAATKQVLGSRRWIALGLVGGLIGAALVALLADAISQAVQGIGAELFNAGVLLTAVVMLGWHNIWMQQHGREMAGQLRATSAAVQSGERSLVALAVVVGIAVLREGSETVLFLYGIATADGGWSDMLVGGGAGIAAGVVVGVVLYFGLLRIPQRYLFSVTSGLILLLAAGLAAQAVNYLAQADILSPLGGSLWDSTWLLDEGTYVGKALHTLIGYTAQPTPMQLIAYLLTLTVIGGLMWVVRPSPPGGTAAMPAPRS
ncbi:MAG: FTR1 family protein [Rhodospirillales bacterium]